MLTTLGHLKSIAIFGLMIGFIRNHTAHHEHYDEVPHFDDDPVPGDSFPHHIFRKH